MKNIRCSVSGYWGTIDFPPVAAFTMFFARVMIQSCGASVATSYVSAKLGTLEGNGGFRRESGNHAKRYKPYSKDVSQ
jgi:hypothetical protein